MTNPISGHYYRIIDNSFLRNMTSSDMTFLPGHPDDVSNMKKVAGIIQRTLVPFVCSSGDLRKKTFP